MPEKTNEIADGVSLEDANRMREIYTEIGKLPYNQQEALLKMAEKRLKTLKVGLEVTAYEEALYKETWQRAKGRNHR